MSTSPAIDPRTPPSASAGMATPPSTSYDGTQGLPEPSPEATAPIEEARTRGGLVTLGSADAAVCEDGFCWVPDTTSE